MGRKMATKNCNPSQVFSLFHDYPIMINLFNNFEALLGRWGEGKRGAGCFITHFDHEVTGFKLQVNLILFCFLFKCV
jgi:hypothetical protein